METNGYFPPWAPGDTRAGIVDDVYDDFERQAERLTGHDQSYIQLTPGAYSGRFLSCAFGPFVSVHFEQANQALEQEVT